MPVCVSLRHILLQQTDFHKTWYERHITVRPPGFVLLHFLLSIKQTWRRAHRQELY
jgi:hypothetical protein